MPEPDGPPGCLGVGERHIVGDAFREGASRVRLGQVELPQGRAHRDQQGFDPGPIKMGRVAILVPCLIDAIDAFGIGLGGRGPAATVGGEADGHLLAEIEEGVEVERGRVLRGRRHRKERATSKGACRSREGPLSRLPGRCSSRPGPEPWPIATAAPSRTAQHATMDPTRRRVAVR